MDREKIVEKVADLFLDFAKLIFAGVVLGSVIIAQFPALYVLIIGIAIMLIFIALAFALLRGQRS